MLVGAQSRSSVTLGKKITQTLSCLLPPRVVTEIALSVPVFLSVTWGTATLILLKSLLSFADGESPA